jgi:hypothetical protein
MSSTCARKLFLIYIFSTALLNVRWNWTFWTLMSLELPIILYKFSHSEFERFIHYCRRNNTFFASPHNLRPHTNLHWKLHIFSVAMVITVITWNRQGPLLLQSSVALHHFPKQQFLHSHTVMVSLQQYICPRPNETFGECMNTVICRWLAVSITFASIMHLEKPITHL